MLGRWTNVYDGEVLSLDDRARNRPPCKGCTDRDGGNQIASVRECVYRLLEIALLREHKNHRRRKGTSRDGRNDARDGKRHSADLPNSECTAGRDTR